MRGTVLALVGAQFGSEGKGVIAKHLAHSYGAHVRTGGPNAGHTFEHEGRTWVARSLPVGWTNPDAALVIGPGALVDLETLIKEIGVVERAGYSVLDRLTVDEKAHIIDPVRHRQFEGGTHGTAHRQIGSTGEGVGPARMAKLARGTFPSDLAWAKARVLGTDYARRLCRFMVTDTTILVNEWINQGTDVLLEGTQGCGLSVTHGEWPYVTSHDTNAATLAADAGIAPGLVETVLVARTFPIRVHGNSGPLYQELAWERLGVEPELTTVTKKQRRIGAWDPALVHKAVRLNRPIGMAITFLDYAWSESRGCERWVDLPVEARRWLANLEDQFGTPVMYVTTGPAGTPVLVNPGLDRAASASRKYPFLDSSVPDPESVS
jgi:adenylosuccinate synthase